MGFGRLRVASQQGKCWDFPACHGAGGDEVVVQVEPRDVGVAWASGSGGVGKRVWLNRKTPAHLVLQGSVGVQSRPRVWKRLRIRVVAGGNRTDATRRRLHQHDGDHGPGHDWTGVG